MKKLSLLAAISLVSCGAPSVVIDAPLAIVNVAPHDGAVGIEATTRPTVCFSEAMDPAAARGALGISEEGGADVTGQNVELSAGDANCLVLAHDKLKADTLLVVRAKKGLRSAGGKALTAEIVSRFKTSP